MKKFIIQFIRYDLAKYNAQNQTIELKSSCKVSVFAKIYLILQHGFKYPDYLTYFSKSIKTWSEKNWFYLNKSR